MRSNLHNRKGKPDASSPFYSHVDPLPPCLHGTHEEYPIYEDSHQNQRSSTWLHCSEKYLRRIWQKTNLPFHLYHVLKASQTTQFTFILLNIFFLNIFFFFFFKNLTVVGLLEEEFCRRIYFINVRARLGTDIGSQTQVECKGQPMCLTCESSVCLCVQLRHVQTVQMLKAGLALELEDILATSAHCKISAKCLFFSLLTQAMQRCPKSHEHLIIFKLAGYIFATAFIPRFFCLS